MRKKTKKNTGVAERHCLSIIPLCIPGKCVLTVSKLDTLQVDGMTTRQLEGLVPSNQVKTTLQSDTLLERNRKENREATPLPSPAKKQAKALIEKIGMPRKRMSEQELRERLQKQIKALRNAS